MFERRHEPLLPKALFILRLSRSMALGLGLVTLCLFFGMCGYHFLESLPWLDSLLNASMILSGMGPVNPLATDAGKLFASFYALFSGVAFITMVGLMFGPIIHRFLHRFHLEFESELPEKPAAPRKRARRSEPE